MAMKNIKDFDVKNKRVLVRCDFNVPLDSAGEIADDFRIQQTLPTIKYLINNKAKIILMSHLDPEGAGVANSKFTLEKVAKKLSEHLQKEVSKTDDCIGENVKKQVSLLEKGDILLLENLRFHKEETENDENFARQLSELGDVYVNDAFAVDHRNNASLVGVPKFLPCCSGLLLEKEITSLDKILQNPERPMVAVIGGKKVETKTAFIERISQVSDIIIISGLLKKEIKEKNIEFLNKDKIIGPIEETAGFDIEEQSIKMFQEKIMPAKTVLWNGPFGKTEDQQYEKGTLAIAEAIIKSRAFSVVGGGETVEFIKRKGIISKFSHVSTGGGAMLAYLAGEELPGIKALS